MFSTWIEGLPGMCLLMCRPIAREWASKPPPAEKPTMMRMGLHSKNFSCPKAGETSDPHKTISQKEQIAADIVTLPIVNASPESRITILIGLLRVNLNVASCCSKVIMSGVNGNVIMSGCGDDHSDDERREAARD